MEYLGVCILLTEVQGSSIGEIDILLDHCVNDASLQLCYVTSLGSYLDRLQVVSTEGVDELVVSFDVFT